MEDNLSQVVTVKGRSMPMQQLKQLHLLRAVMLEYREGLVVYYEIETVLLLRGE